MLQITTQPKLDQNYWRCHGKLCGQLEEADYPTLRLSVPKTKYIPGTEYHMLCTLHTYRENLDSYRNDDDKKILPLSGHFIQKISGADDCADDEHHTNCNSNIFEIMKLHRSSNNQNVFYGFKMKNCRIVLVDWKTNGATDDNNWKSLNERKSQIIKMNMEFVNDGADDKYDETVFSLGFTAFEKLSNSDHFTAITPTIYSKRISLDSSLYVQRIIPTHGDIGGGEEVALLFDSLKQYNTATVKVYTYISDRKIDIASIEIIQKKDKTPDRYSNIIWNKNTILFQAPALPTYLQDNYVYIEIYIPSTMETSNCVTFGYTKNRTDEAFASTTKKKVAMSGKLIGIYDPTDKSYGVKILSSNLKWILMHDSVSEDFHQRFGDEFQNYIHKVSKLCSSGYRVEVNNGYTTVLPINVILLSEAIEEDFNKVNRSLTSPMTTLTARRWEIPDSKLHILSHSNALECAMDFFHAYREQMIAEESRVNLYPRPAAKRDYECFYVMSADKSFQPMVTSKCSLVEQGIDQNTPLHTAIALRHRKCIDQFIDIFANYAKYSKDFQEDLKTIFSIYNRDGHNVMHAAIWNNMEDLVKAMLEYCKENSINIEDYKMANGTAEVSILQLAIDNKLPDIVNLILDYTPVAKLDVGEQSVESIDKS